MFKRLILIYSIFFVVSLLSDDISAAPFGYGPCCPPSLCGTIPCDRTCSGNALMNMGLKISSGFNEQTTLQNKLTKAANNATKSVGAMSAAIEAALIYKKEEVISQISANTNKLDLALQMSSKGMERSSNELVQKVSLAFKESEIARSVANNERNFGEQSQPLSGDILVNKARAFKALLVQQEQLEKEMLEGFNGYINDDKHTKSSAGSNSHLVRSIQTINELESPSSIVVDDVLDDEEFKTIQQLLGLFVAREPLRVGKPRETEYELQRRLYVAKLNMIFSALSQSAVSRIGLDDRREWEDYYEELGKNQEGKASLYSFLQSDITSRLTNSEWYGSMLKMNTVGLQRELTYQEAMSNHIKQRLLLLGRKDSELFALLLAKNLNNHQVFAERK